MNPHQVLSLLTHHSGYLQWHHEHPRGFCSHFFCRLRNDGVPLPECEVGFYDPSTEKITVFVVKDHLIEQKPPEEVFQKPGEVVEPLLLEHVTCSFETARETFWKQLPVLFPGEQTGEGFLILQTRKGKAMWSFSFTTHSIQFLNLQVNAHTGEIESHNTISLVRSGPKEGETFL